MPESDESSLRPSPSDIAVGIGLYFKYCHRQPIWCFSREDVSDYGTLPGELACSIMVLTSRFSEKRDQLQLYSDSAKHLVMLRLASGTVDLTTIESLCLLSYSSFIGKSEARRRPAPEVTYVLMPMATQTETFTLASSISASHFSSAGQPCWTWSRYMPSTTRTRKGRRDFSGACSCWNSFMGVRTGS